MHTPKDNFMKKIIAYICICLASLTVARAQSAAVGGQETLPVDSAVLIGRLPNGITYYIRHNGDQPRREIGRAHV